MLKESCGIKKSNIDLDSFEMYFKAVNNHEDRFFTPDDDVLYFLERYEKNEFDIMFQELNMPLTHEELIKSIKQLKNNKAGGPDMHLNEFFIHGKDNIVPYLVTLFNTFLSWNIFQNHGRMVLLCHYIKAA